MFQTKTFVYCVAILCLLFSQPVLSQSVHAKAPLQKSNGFRNVPVEITFTGNIQYDDPLYGVEVDAIVTGPTGVIQKVPAFWAGGKTWKVRYASVNTGRYTWRIQCSNKNDLSLNTKEGTIDIKPYTGSSILYRSGAIRIAEGHRHFEYADGKPFLWLGDTWWKGLSKRISFNEFKILTADRKKKGFNVVQIIAGPYPDEPAFDPRWANEGGMPYTAGYATINPAYFNYADKRIEHLIQEGLLPAIVGGWGWHMESVGVEKLKRHWRNIIARYAAYPVTWIAGGESGGEDWTAVARYIRDTDPFHRLVTMHSYPGSGRMYIPDETVLDFDMLQTGHGGFFGYASPYGVWQATAANTVSKVMAAYSKTPAMPVVLGEVTYEGHMQTNGAEVQRQVYWSSMLSGAAGFTYGAGGIWQMNSAIERGAEYEFTPWFEAMKLPGAAQLATGKKLLEQYRWWLFEPHPEWVNPHSSALFEPHDKWFDDSTKFAEGGGQWDRPYAAGIGGEVRFIYIPGHYYDWTTPTIKNLEADIPYHAFLVDPANGKPYELGILINTSDLSKQTTNNTLIKKELKNKLAGLKEVDILVRPKGEKLVMHENPNILPAVTIPAITRLSSDEYKMPRLPAPQDWLLVLERLK